MTVVPDPLVAIPTGVPAIAGPPDAVGNTGPAGRYWAMAGVDPRSKQRIRFTAYLTTSQFNVTAPGVMLPDVQLHTSKFTFPLAG